MAIQVGIRDAKARLSTLVRGVRRGDVVTITDRGRPVARMVPVAPADTSLDDRMREMVERGQISPARRPSTPPPPPVSMARRGIAQRYLRESRDAR